MNIRPMDALEGVLDLVVYLGVVALGIGGALTGRPELLVLIPLAYVAIALNPRYGRWRHVWD